MGQVLSKQKQKKQKKRGLFYTVCRFKKKSTYIYIYTLILIYNHEEIKKKRTVDTHKKKRECRGSVRPSVLHNLTENLEKR